MLSRGKQRRIKLLRCKQRENDVVFINRTDPVCIFFWGGSDSSVSLFFSRWYAVIAYKICMYDRKQKKKKRLCWSIWIEWVGPSLVLCAYKILFLPSRIEFIWNLGCSHVKYLQSYCIDYEMYPHFGVMPGQDINWYHRQLSKFLPHIIMFNFLLLVQMIYGLRCECSFDYSKGSINVGKDGYRVGAVNLECTKMSRLLRRLAKITEE